MHTYSANGVYERPDEAVEKFHPSTKLRMSLSPNGEYLHPWPPLGNIADNSVELTEMTHLLCVEKMLLQLD